MHTFAQPQHTHARAPRGAGLQALALLALLSSCQTGGGATGRASRPMASPAPPEAAPYHGAVASAASIVPGAPGAPDEPGAGGSALPETLDEHIRWALEHNPGVGGLAAEFAARREAPRRAGALPDPKLSITHYLEPVQTRVGPQRSALGLVQALPWFGTLGLREKAAEQMADQAGWRWRSGQLDLVRSVRRAWFELTWLGRTARVLEEHLQLLTLHAEAVRSRFTTGGATHDQLVRSGLETDLVRDRLRALENRTGPARARLAQTLGTPLPRPDVLPGNYGELSADELWEEAAPRIPDNHPELLFARAHIERARAEVLLAERQRFPDLAVGLRWIETGEEAGIGGADAGTDPWMATLTLDLPLDRERIAAGEREARHRQRSATLSLDGARQSLDARLAATTFELSDAGRRAALHREALVPRAQAALEATEASFRAGGARFIDLLDAERVLLDLQLSLESALRDRALARADLNCLLARPLPDLSTFTSATPSSSPATVR